LEICDYEQAPVIAGFKAKARVMLILNRTYYWTAWLYGLISVYLE